MGKYLKRFRQGAKKVDRKVSEMSRNDEKRRIQEEYRTDGFSERQRPEKRPQNDYDDMPEDDFNEPDRSFDDYDDVNVQSPQKPESFHHYILENKYQDLEKNVKGYKDVFNKEKQIWEVKRKKEHCFTDEEAEEILRTAQSHLATDIKLSYINEGVFNLLMDTIYKELAFLFETISEYRYGRYNNFTKDGVLISVDYEKQYRMKAQNNKIFLELFTRIMANYSRAIKGQENKLTHGSVATQESLQQSDRSFDNKRYS